MRTSTALLSLFWGLSSLYISFASQDHQVAMGSEPEYTPQTTTQPTLSDLLTIEPSASIFYSYARELEMSSMLSDQGAKLTLFVPTNKAVMGLSRKPHQGPDTTVEVEISEEEFHNRAKKHVERWVSAHILPEHPLSFDTNTHATLLDGKAISFKPISKVSGHGAEWSRVTLDNGAKIVGKKEGLNGDLYLIDGTILLD